VAPPKKKSTRKSVCFSFFGYVHQKSEWLFAPEAQKNRFAFPPQPSGRLRTSGKARNIRRSRNSGKVDYDLHTQKRVLFFFGGLSGE